MEKVNIKGVPETMLQTLYARAAYSRQKKAKFHDDEAEEIVSRMDYDFSIAGKDAMMSRGVIARTILLDRMVADFIRKNPGCTVVNIACGMDTRVYRLKKIHLLQKRWEKSDGIILTCLKPLRCVVVSLKKTDIFP